MKNVLVLGELLMRLTPKNKLRFSQCREFDIYFGGAEANVAVSLVNLGVKSKILSCVPRNEIGMACKDFFSANGVDCSNVILKDDSRLGLYYYEEECSARRGKVIYDRNYSAITKLDEKDFDYDEIFKDIELLHVSGITFGLGENISQIAYKVLNQAKQRGIKVSVDLNYRKTLFKDYEEFYNCMLPVVKDAYICFGWLTEGVKNLEVLDGSSIHDVNQLKVQLDFMKDLGVKYVATTIREGLTTGSASLTGIIYDGKSFLVSDKFNFKMFSRISGGDAFAAGVIKGLLTQDTINKFLIDFAVANAVLKHSSVGDVPISKEEEVIEFLNYQNMGNVCR